MEALRCGGALNWITELISSSYLSINPSVDPENLEALFSSGLAADYSDYFVRQAANPVQVGLPHEVCLLILPLEVRAG